MLFIRIYNAKSQTANILAGMVESAHFPGAQLPRCTTLHLRTNSTEVESLIPAPLSCLLEDAT